MELSKRLKEERSRRHLSLRDAAAMIGISHTYLSSLERGYDIRTGSALSPSEDVLLKVCRAYEIDVREIVPTVDLRHEEEFLIFAAKRIHGLKKSNPRAYARLLDIIMNSSTN